MNGHALKELARYWAMVAHDGVSRKGAGEPYFNHVERVADNVWGWRRKALAYLHDTVEDAEDSERMEIGLRVAFPDDIIDDVMTLSRMPYRNPNVIDKATVTRDEYWIKQPYQEWIEEIAASGNADVIAVKLADVNDNLHDITDIPGMEGMQIRYMKAQSTLMEVS